ncbi:hypothetical protein D3C76_1523270 [compost metagenome]
MHQQAAQKAAELFQRLFMVGIFQVTIVTNIDFLIGGDVMVDRIKTRADADHHRDHGQGIQEGREQCSGNAEGQR